jgi:hypothetical protein
MIRQLITLLTFILLSSCKSKLPMTMSVNVTGNPTVTNTFTSDDEASQWATQRVEVLWGEAMTKGESSIFSFSCSEGDFQGTVLSPNYKFSITKNNRQLLAQDNPNNNNWNPKTEGANLDWNDVRIYISQELIKVRLIKLNRKNRENKIE